MTPKNGKLKRKVGSRLVRDLDMEMLEARLLVERMESEADYRSRGRRLEALTDGALKRRWLQCLRREFSAIRRRRTEMDDIGAELSLRGIVNVKLPPDLIELITAGIRKPVHPDSAH